MSQLSPTVGRVVHLWDRDTFHQARMGDACAQPRVATITYVHDDGRIAVHENACPVRGPLSPRELKQIAINLPEEVAETPLAHLDPVFATWMPYQVGQAARSDGRLDALIRRLMVVETAVLTDIPISDSALTPEQRALRDGANNMQAAQAADGSDPTASRSPAPPQTSPSPPDSSSGRTESPKDAPSSPAAASPEASAPPQEAPPPSTSPPQEPERNPVPPT